MSRYKFKPSRKPVKEKKSSYEGIICPCGGKKERETMLCPECVTHFRASRPSLFDYLDGSKPLEWRRSDAIILCSLARTRKQLAAPQRGLALSFPIT